MNDLRYSLRSLMRMRGVAAIAVVTLALGIGATTTMFSAAYAALLAAAAVCRSRSAGAALHDPDVAARRARCVRAGRARLIETLTASVTSYQALASFTPSLVSLSGGNGDPEQIDCRDRLARLLRILRVSPALGRTFTAAEDGAPGDAPVAILSDALWRRRYGADPSLIGGPVRINDVPLTVVGIMPAGFAGLSDKSEMWIPRTMAPRLTYAEYLTTPQLFIAVVARLKDGVTLEQANAELAAASAAFAFPDASRARGGARSPQRAGDARIEPTLRRSVLLLLAAAAAACC